MSAERLVYLNGEFLPLNQAKVSVLDRGFLFGDGVYEVIPVYAGRPFRLPHHLQRLQQSLSAIHLESPLSQGQWQGVVEELIQRNGGGEQSLYLQVTRGASFERDHALPASPSPTLFAMTTPLQPAPQKASTAGLHAITVEDIRWQLCQIKAITLLPNILLRQQALQAGAEEAIMLRDGMVSEGTASNVFIVLDGCAITPPSGTLLLPGVTRDLVLELCRRHAIPCEERAITEEELRSADEIWLTSSTREIIPVTMLDGVPVSGGEACPLWQLLIGHYRTYLTAFREGRET